MDNSTNRPTPETYYYLFQKDAKGVAVFEELCGLFYDIASYTKNDPYHTAYLEGSRAVMKFIINKMAQQTTPLDPDEPESM